MPQDRDSHQPPHSAVDIAAVVGAVRRARLRLWLNTTWARAMQAAPYAIVLAAAWLVATRLAWVDTRYDSVGDLAVATVAAVCAVFALAHRVSLLTAARILDRVAANHDALATAGGLRQAGRADSWAMAQARAANRTAGELRIASLVPVALWPAGTGLALGLAGLLAGAGLAPLAASVPWRAAPQVVFGADPALPEAPAGFAAARDALGEDATSLLGADAALLREIEDQVADPATRNWLRDLREVIEGVQDGSLDKREALEKLAALEANKPSPPHAAAEPEATPAPTADPSAAAEAERQRDIAARQAVLDAADKALDEAPKGQDKEDLKQAVEKGDLGLVAKLMEKLASKELSADDVKKWQKTLEKFADALKDRKVPKELEALAKKVERLQQQRNDQGGLPPAEQRRLQEARHQLEQLRKQIGDVQGAEHQVQRLEREARTAADELRRQQEMEAQKTAKPPDAKQQAQRAQQALRQAADELRRQDEGHKARQAQRVGQSRLRDVRDALGRSGQRQQSQQGRGQPNNGADDDKPCEGGQPGQQGGSRQSADGKQSGGRHKGDRQGPNEGDKGDRSEASGQGDQGKQSGKGRRDQQGHNSGDNGGKAEAGGQGDQGQQGEQRMRQGGEAERPGFRLGSKGLGDKTRTELINEGYEQRAGKGGNQGGSRSQQGPGQGGGKGGPDQGKDPKLASARTEKLKGEQGDGPDTKRVFLDTARKGFARQGWRQAYREYSEVAEEMVDKESLPAGRKALVRRYFEKIRPR